MRVTPDNVAALPGSSVAQQPVTTSSPAPWRFALRMAARESEAASAVTVRY
jgi:hypothetical protein